MAKQSKIFNEIQRLVLSGELPMEFNVSDIKKVSKIIENSSPFLSKHRENNPGKHTPYFKRVRRGVYTIK